MVLEGVLSPPPLNKKEKLFTKTRETPPMSSGKTRGHLTRRVVTQLKIGGVTDGVGGGKRVIDGVLRGVGVKGCLMGLMV